MMRFIKGNLSRHNLWIDTFEWNWWIYELIILKKLKFLFLLLMSWNM